MGRGRLDKKYYMYTWNSETIFKRVNLLYFKENA